MLSTIYRSALAVGVAALTTLTVFSAVSANQNWPEWRGPLRNGVAPNANPPLNWTEQAGVKWKVQLPGKGTSTPIVWGQDIFLHTAIPTGKKVASYPTAISSPVPAGQTQADQERPRRRGPGGGGGRSSEKPTEEHQFVLLAIARGTGIL